jgi:hypothetical protein
MDMGEGKTSAHSHGDASTNSSTNGTGPVPYILLVLRAALRHSFHSAHSILLGLIIIVGLLTYFVPRVKVMVDLHGWQVATFVLGSIVGVRLVLAPYWLWRDQQIENQKLVQQLDRSRVRQEALDGIASLRARVANLRIRMEADARSQMDWTREFEGLRKDIADKIKQGFGAAEAELYTTAGNLDPKSSVNVADANHRLQLEFCIRDLDYLGEFIRRFQRD